jgi:pimeloyl-ACP methyl ester carboxylesterase
MEDSAMRLSTRNQLRGKITEVELVDGVGHWIVDQRPDLVLDRVRAFLAET